MALTLGIFVERLTLTDVQEVALKDGMIVQPAIVENLEKDGHAILFGVSKSTPATTDPVLAKLIRILAEGGHPVEIRRVPKHA